MHENNVIDNIQTAVCKSFKISKTKCFPQEGQDILVRPAIYLQKC